MTKDKKLRLFNGRLSPYEHGYIAAYSVADAVRVWHEAMGDVRGALTELNIYWSKDAWGIQMIGITPERGMWAQRSDGSIVRLVNRREYPVTERGPEWDEYQKNKKAEREAYEAEQKAAWESKVSRIRKLASFLIAVGLRVGVKGDVALVEFDGHEYEVTESGDVTAR